MRSCTRSSLSNDLLESRQRWDRSIARVGWHRLLAAGSQR